MAGKANPRRYAQAVFDLAQEQNKFDAWQADLHLMAAAAKSDAFLDVLETPGISEEDKTRFLMESLKGVSPLAMNLAKLLVSQLRMTMITEIAEEYSRMLDAARGVESAIVTTAVPLDEADKYRLKEQLSVLTGKNIEMTVQVDPEILGGVVARVGGRLLDGSTRSKLAALKRQLEIGK